MTTISASSVEPTSRTRRWTIREKQYAIRLYVEGGFSLRRVSRITGISNSTLRGWMEQDGIPRRDRMEESLKASQGIPKRGYERLHEMVRLYFEEELSTNQIAARMGLNNSTVAFTLRNNGYLLRSKSENLRLAYKKGRRQPNNVFTKHV